MKKNTIKKIVAASLFALSMVSFAGCSNTATAQGNTANNTDTKLSASGNSSAGSTGVKGVVNGTDIPSLKGKTIGVAAIGTYHNFDKQVYKGIQDRIQELGGTAIAVDGERNDQKHIADIENLITQKPDAIVKTLGDVKVYEPVLKKVSDSKIPLFTVDIASQYSISNTQSDNYYIGEYLARKLFEDIGGEGKVAVFNGFYGVRPCGIRYDMLKYVAKDYPKVQFIDPELQEILPGTIEDAKKKTQDLLAKYPNKGDIKAIWSAWDTPSIGITQALDEAGRTDIKVYGVDGDPVAIDLLADKNSSLYTDVAQDPYKIGQASVDSIALYLSGQQVPKSVYIQPLVVTKENAEEAKKQLFK
ncbi:MAG: sugar ABC transporter substrate-binding protein [Clostridiaceae bacterium]